MRGEIAAIIKEMIDGDATVRYTPIHTKQI
ncbi:hypothetical protein KL86DPRO_60159 [uncultured delta proteobacterium]|uniref:Uncharacterized protein n=1 Tax=uncultured delta proteobacterium TaxID=34034 RepID=A0A212KFM3_9DELT|nr:hypothetical protein KL86DPRO_60159 [uncultured delta proteobacterium]